MAFEIDDAKRLVKNYLERHDITFLWNDYNSGSPMLDVRKSEALYVIQIEHDSIGLSIFDGFDFTTVPDERFYDLASFLQQLSKIFEMDSQ